MTQLPKATIDRSHDAVVQMIAEHRDYLSAVIRARIDARLSARLDVSDIVQEAQIEALRRLSSFLKRPTVTLKQWLRKIACDQVVMARRKHLVAEKRSLTLETREIGTSDGRMDRIVGPDNTASCILGKRQESERLRSALKSLSNDDQMVIRFQVFEQLNSQEAASVLGVSAVAVRQRLCRAMIRLREIMVNGNDLSLEQTIDKNGPHTVLSRR